MAPSSRLLLSLIVFAHFTSVVISTAGTPTTVVTRLIHRDSIESPCYNNTKESLYDCVEHPWRDSEARQYSRRKSYDVERSHLDDIEANLRPGEVFPLFFIKFYAGVPPSEQYALLDTASSYLWIHCVPCSTCPVTLSRMYSPRASSTYRSVPCKSSFCELAGGICDTANACEYTNYYISGFESLGNLATETLSFDIGRVPNVVFGCHHRSKPRDSTDKLMTGVFGLGYTKLSILDRFNKFSYCVGGINNPDYRYNKLVLGDGAVLQGDPTSLEFDGPRYYVTLEHISLGGVVIDIPTGTFAFSKGPPKEAARGVIVDSGATFTALTEDAHYAVMDVVEDKMRLPTRLTVNGNRLCFEGKSWKQATRGFPTLRLHFSGGAQLALEPDSLFAQFDETFFCMTFKQSSKQYSIIGMYAQNHYNVGYDLARKKVYFQRMDCRLV